jgi:ApaG protein
MTSKITKGVNVSVNTRYQPDHSNPKKKEYAFSYKVTIENVGDQTIKLLRRHWYIFDSNNDHREVEGEGVVGKQPVIAPNEKYEYVSSCLLNSSFGRMHGTFLMERETDGEQFKVVIPAFKLEATPRKN